MKSRENKLKLESDINLSLDSLIETTPPKEESKSLSDIINEIEKRNKIDDYSYKKLFKFQLKPEVKHQQFVSDRLEEIVTLIKENSVSSTNFSELRKNQKHIINEIKIVQEQNAKLLSQVAFLQSQNTNLKHLLLKNTSDKRIRSVSAGFLILFSISLVLYYVNDFELVKIEWTKLGIIVSTGVYFIGFFIGKMVKKLKINDV